MRGKREERRERHQKQRLHGEYNESLTLITLTLTFLFLKYTLSVSQESLLFTGLLVCNEIKNLLQTQFFINILQILPKFAQPTHVIGKKLSDY